MLYKSARRNQRSLYSVSIFVKFSNHKISVVIDFRQSCQTMEEAHVESIHRWDTDYVEDLVIGDFVLPGYSQNSTSTSQVKYIQFVLPYRSVLMTQAFLHSNLGICCWLPVFPHLNAQLRKGGGCFAYTFIQLDLKRKVVCCCRTQLGELVDNLNLVVFDNGCGWDCSSLARYLGHLQAYGKTEEIACFVEAVHQGLKLSF